jgi:hypothetical protein
VELDVADVPVLGSPQVDYEPVVVGAHVTEMRVAVPQSATRRRDTRRSAGQRYGDGRPDAYCRPTVQLVGPDGIKDVCELGRTRVGSDHASADVLGARLVRQPGCVAVHRAASSTIEAVSVLYVLTNAATADVLERRLLNGTMITSDALAGERDGASIYVGSIVSVPGRGRSALVLVCAHALHLLSAHPNIRWLFGRAATPEGARLLERLGLRELGAPSQVCARALEGEVVSHLRTEADTLAGSPRQLLRLLVHLDDRFGRNDHL